VLKMGTCFYSVRYVLYFRGRYLGKVCLPRASWVVYRVCRVE